MAASLEKRTTNFLEKAFKIHGILYDYSNIEYINNKTNVEIICQEHGPFWQQPIVHLMGSGCQKCSKKEANDKLRLGRDTFITRSKKIHLIKYDYSKVIYIDTKTPVEIICPEHGSFWQKPMYHLEGSNCPECATNSLRLDTNSFKEKVYNICGDKYTVVGKYVGSQIKIEIFCNKCKKTFWKNPNNILSGSDCPICSATGFKLNFPAILYYLQDITNGLYKIGITNRTLEKRFGKKMEEIKIIKTWYFEDGSDAYELEQFLHCELLDFQIINENFAEVGGKTEFFNKDILNLDTERISND